MKGSRIAIALLAVALAGTASRIAGAERKVFVSFPLKLSIGLMVEQQEVAVTGRAAFKVTCGAASFAAAAGEKWKAKRISGEAAKLEFYPIVATFPLEQLDEAKKLAEKWHQAGHESTVIAAGAELVTDQQAIVNDNRRYYVHVGRFTDDVPAQAFLQELIKMGEKPWLFEKLVEAAHGTVALVDPAGQERARGPSVSWEGGEPMKVFAVHHDVGFPQDGIEDREYEGAVTAQFDKRGLLAAVNVIELDSYLKGVVPSEIFTSDPAATIAAQAVAARGETLSGLGLKMGGQPYDLCSDQNCQEYTGLKLQQPSTTQGVQATRGEVLKRGAKIVEAVYSDTCGGHTENVEYVWSTPADPSLVGIPDCLPGTSQLPHPFTEATLAKWIDDNPTTFCSGQGSQMNPSARWTVKLTGAELDARINKVQNVGTVRELVPGERGVSGRLRSLKVVGSTSTFTILKELPIRKALGGFKSALFVVSAERDASGRAVTWTFRGAGRGHGVGMCQVGARWAARAGYDYKKILNHYFSGTAVVKVY